MTDSLIGILVDHSGSMGSMAPTMTRSIAEFINGQKELPGKAEVTLAQFDNTYNLVYPLTPINKVPHYTLLPAGRTALLDAMGKFITDIGVELAGRKPSKRPSKVIVVVVTDGYENASREWTYSAIRELVGQQQNVYSWEFVFLGANIDAVAEAGRFGIRRDSALMFTPSNAGYVTTNTLANYVNTTRSGVYASFSAQDRKEAMSNKTVVEAQESTP